MTDVDTCGPPPKRAKLQRRSVSEKVLRLREPIRNYLNVPELISQTLHSDDIDFLKDREEHNIIWKLCDEGRPSRYLSDRVLSFIKIRETESERDDAARKFVACVVKANEHRGHLDLTKIFLKKLGKEEWCKIQDILERVCDSPLGSPYVTPQHSPLSPEKPVPLITLQGQVTEQEFVKIERELWDNFSTGKYDAVDCLVEVVQRKCVSDRMVYNVDCEIVAMWFQSLVLMHRDKKYKGAIQLLKDAEGMSQGSDNEKILKGRIYQRMAQIYLMMQDQINATVYFKKAKDELQFVGRGYDKTNMYCREAKVLSATEPHRRDDIEKVYEKALTTLQKDDPYFLASYPSVTLSKAAFHLHVAFGSKTCVTGHPSAVSTEDITKARETLKGFREDEHILIDMRRNEYDFLQAELCRLEGKSEEAKRRFTGITKTGASIVKNVFFLATHRLSFMNKTTGAFEMIT